MTQTAQSLEKNLFICRCLTFSAILPALARRLVREGEPLSGKALILHMEGQMAYPLESIYIAVKGISLHETLEIYSQLK